MNRIDRINEEVKKALSDIIANEIKDPRLPAITSITDVKVTKDLKYADIFFSVLGDEAQRASALSAVKSASGFIRRELSKRVGLRITPELRFREDRSIEKGIYMNLLIDKVIKDDEERNKIDE